MDPNELQPDNNQPQVIKPEQMFNPSVPPYQPPQNPAPAQTPAPGTGTSANDVQPPMDNGLQRRKILIIIISSLVALFIIIVLVVILTSSNDKKNQDQNDQNGQSSGLFTEPTALDVQNANNSITSDITSLNDDSDFPAANLSDTNLSL